MAEKPPTDRDLFSLASSADITEINQAMDAALDQPPDENTGVPPRAVQIGNILVARTVGIIRTGSLHDAMESALPVTRSVARRESKIKHGTYVLEGSHEKAFRDHASAATMLSAAAASTSLGSEYAVLRAEDGIAAKIVHTLASQPEQEMGYDELRNLIGIDAREFWWMLCHLNDAALAEAIPGTGKVFLKPRDQANITDIELLGLAQLHARRFDDHQQARA